VKERKLIINRVFKKVGRAIEDFNLIEGGDRILVAVSGGKDSLTLLSVLEDLRKRAPVSFSLIPVNLDQGFPGYRQDKVRDFFSFLGFNSYRLIKENTYKIVKEKTGSSASFCALCARLRRGILYRVAIEEGCNKLALGHHRDDFIETFLLNLFFSGVIKSMQARMLAENGRVEVIRPLVYVSEDETREFASKVRLPVICCGCPVCGSRALERERIRIMLNDLKMDNPGIRGSIFNAYKRMVSSNQKIKYIEKKPDLNKIISSERNLSKGKSA